MFISRTDWLLCEENTGVHMKGEIGNDDQKEIDVHTMRKGAFTSKHFSYNIQKMNFHIAKNGVHIKEN